MNYRGKLKEFFDYLGLPGSDLEEQGQAFLDKVRKEYHKQGGNEHWAQDKIMSYLAKQIERVQNKEIRAGTIGNFYRPIKVFCDEYDDITDKMEKDNKSISSCKIILK